MSGTPGDYGYKNGLLVLLALLGLVFGCSAPAEPTPTPQETLEAAAERMAALTSLSFILTHEEGRTRLLAGIEAEKAEGVVALPDQASLQVEAVATAINAFISFQVVVNGPQAYMTDPLKGTWQELPTASLPFNFQDLGNTLGGIVRALDDPRYTSTQNLAGVPSLGVAGTVAGQRLSALIPSAVPDAEVRLEVWVGEDHLIRRVRIEGSVAANDPPKMVRVLALSAFDEPVAIDIPR